MSSEHPDLSAATKQPRLTLIEWCLTPEGLRVACRCACGWLTVVRVGDFAYGRVTACAWCSSTSPASPQLREWLAGLLAGQDASVRVMHPPEPFKLTACQ